MTRVMTCAALLVLACLMLRPSAVAGDPQPALPGQAPSAGGAPRVTSHSLEYCTMLAGRYDAIVQEMHDPPGVEVNELAAEGRRMCADGRVRGGILRLRKALLRVQQPEHPP